MIPVGATETYGSVDLEQLKIGTFAPTGTQVETGLFAVLAVDGTVRSTAISLYRSGEWLVKVRISSRTLSVRRMGALLRDTLGRLPAMDTLDTAPAYFIEECETPLAFTQALPFNDPKGQMALALEASIHAMTIGTTAFEDEGGLPAHYCREGGRREQFNVYRAGGSDDSYDVALGDAGAGFTVFPLKLYGAEPGGTSAVPVHRVQSSTGMATIIHRPFVGLPTIQQAANSVFQQQALAEVSRPLGGENVDVTLMGSSEVEAGSN